MRLVWSRRATRDAEHAAEWIAKDRRDGALEWLDGLHAAVLRLQQFPFSGHVLPEIPLAARRPPRSCGWRTDGVTCVRGIAA